jgi:PAS domain S-box-containing protein
MLARLQGADCQCLYVNQRWAEFTGRRPEELMGNGWLEQIHPDDRANCIRKLEQAGQDHQPYEMVYRLRHRDSHYRWILDCGKPSFTTAEEFHGFICFCFELASDMPAAASDPALLGDLGIIPWEAESGRRRFTYIAPQVERILGYPQSAWYRPDFWRRHLFPGDQRRVRSEIASGRAEYRMVTADGSIVWLREVTNQNATEGERENGYFEDISGQQQQALEMLELSDRDQILAGKNLYDDLCQRLAGLSFIAKALELQLNEQRQAEPATMATYLSEQLHEAVLRCKKIADDLYPSALEMEGLEAALTDLASASSAAWGANCTIEVSPAARQARSTVSVHLFRLAQDAVSLSASIGRLSALNFSLKLPRHRLILGIRAKLSRKINAAKLYCRPEARAMRYRAQLIGAELSFSNCPNGDLLITCSLPHLNHRSD